MEKLLRRRAIIKYMPVPPAGDVLRTNANITAARTAFGYSPKTNIAQGLENFVEWYLDYYGPDGKRRAPDELTYVPD